MKKIWMSVMMALCLLMGTASADQYEGFTYTAYYPQYVQDDGANWMVTDYAVNEGVLLYMHGVASEVTVSLQSRAAYPGLEELAAAQLELVQNYGALTQSAAVSDWYAAWDDTQAGRKMRFSYKFLRGSDDAVYDVIQYMAVLNDDHYLLVDVVDRSGDAERVAAELEGGFLRSLQVGSFSVTGSTSAFLTGVNEKDGTVYLTLQPYDVQLSEDGMGYSVQVTGEPLVVPMGQDARMLAPVDQNTGMLADIEISERAIRSFMDGYRMINGDDCVFNLLFSDGTVRWMTYSYLY